MEINRTYVDNVAELLGEAINEIDTKTMTPQIERLLFAASQAYSILCLTLTTPKEKNGTPIYSSPDIHDSKL